MQRPSSVPGREDFQYNAFLLTFADEQLERTFWAGPVRHNLARIDQCSGALLIMFNICLAAAFSKMDKTSGLVSEHVKWAAICGPATLACNVLAFRYSPAFYNRHRNTLIAILRSLVFASMYRFAQIYAAIDGQHICTHGAVVTTKGVAMQAGANAPDIGPQLALYFLLKALVLRTFVMVIWLVFLAYPMSFAHNCAFALLVQPILLVGTVTTAHFTAQPPFVGAVCRIYGVLSRFVVFGASRDGSCPAFAPSLVAYTYWLLFGFFGPLLVLREVEWRYRRSFLALFTFQGRWHRSGRAALMNVGCAGYCAIFALLAVAVVNILHWILVCLDVIAH